MLSNEKKKKKKNANQQEAVGRKETLGTANLFLQIKGSYAQQPIQDH